MKLIMHVALDNGNNVYLPGEEVDTGSIPESLTEYLLSHGYASQRQDTISEDVEAPGQGSSGGKKQSKKNKKNT